MDKIPWTPQDVLAGLALLLMGALSGALVFKAVPPDNMQLVTFALGAISGALTVGGVNKAAAALHAPQPAPPHEP